MPSGARCPLGQRIAPSISWGTISGVARCPLREIEQIRRVSVTCCYGGSSSQNLSDSLRSIIMSDAQLLLVPSTRSRVIRHKAKRQLLALIWLCQHQGEHRIPYPLADMPVGG